MSQTSTAIKMDDEIKNFDDVVAGLMLESIENHRKKAEILITNREVQLAFFKEHKIAAFLLGRICEKLERDIANLKLQITGYKLAATSLKISNPAAMK